MDAAYVKRLRSGLCEAAEDAAADLREATLSLVEEAIEPLGYNRRKGNFSGVDPVLKAAIFRTGKKKTYLLNYACHAVVFGPKKHVSADWPGAVIRGIEKAGHRAVLLQGFCGDIDPVLQMNRWGEGTEDDLLTLADLVWRRLVKAENYAVPQTEVRLAAAERRVDIPLSIHGKRMIEREAAAFGKTYSKFPGAARFAQAWKALALENAPARRKSPYVPNVPLQALAIGGLRLIGLPAEVFCEYGLKLRKTFPSLMPLGFANGNIGYVPAGRDFRDETDYACYCAPMFYQLFPFTSDVERILLGESRALLRSL
jgi:hypothetical protein